MSRSPPLLTDCLPTEPARNWKASLHAESYFDYILAASWLGQLLFGIEDCVFRIRAGLKLGQLTKWGEL